jgi:hypothetical protein
MAMTVYDVLRRLVEARPFQDHERIEALRLLDELQALNIFGTVAGQVKEGHDHEWVALSSSWRRCKVCSLEGPIT